MKSTGIVRKLDNVGRLVIPIELRKLMNIEEKEAAVEIYTQDDTIILKKFQRTCLFCQEGEGDELIEYKGKYLCRKCAEAIKNTEE